MGKLKYVHIMTTDRQTQNATDDVKKFPHFQPMNEWLQLDTWLLMILINYINAE